jgi:hypothetical protein
MACSTFYFPMWSPYHRIKVLQSYCISFITRIFHRTEYCIIVDFILFPLHHTWLLYDLFEMIAYIDRLHHGSMLWRAVQQLKSSCCKKTIKNVYALLLCTDDKQLCTYFYLRKSMHVIFLYSVRDHIWPNKTNWNRPKAENH